MCRVGKDMTGNPVDWGFISKPTPKWVPVRPERIKNKAHAESWGELGRVSQVY